MLAGFCAGITEALIIVTPFEVVKIRLQQQKGLEKAALKYRVRNHSPARVQVCMYECLPVTATCVQGACLCVCTRVHVCQMHAAD